MKSFSHIYIINAPLKQVWNALTIPEEIENWGAGPAQMEDLPGARFSLWNGEIHGWNTKVVSQKELHQDWFGGKWSEPSKVVITLNQSERQTKVELHHTNIPDSDFEDIKKGWSQYYFGPLKDYCEKN